MVHTFLKLKKSLTLNGASVTLPSQVQHMKQIMKLRNIINQTLCTINKVVPVHAMKACKGRLSIAPLILILAANGVQGVMTQPLYPRQRTWHLLNRRLVGTRSQSGQFREEFNLLSLPEFALWIIQPMHCKLQF